MELAEFKLLMQEMQSNIESRFASLESQLAQNEDKITSKINTHINKKFEGLNKDLNEMRTRLENQEKRLYYLEKSSVERNLVFFGVCETEKSYFDLHNSILNIIKLKIGVQSIQSFEIQSVKRLGKKGSKPRPISVTLSTLGAKINILKHKKQLQGSEIYISPEYPTAILEKRKALKDQLKSELEKGNLAYIKYDKLIIKEKTPNNTNNKRQLSLSPNQPNFPIERQSVNDSTSTQGMKSNQLIKKHKTSKNTMHSYVTHKTNA